MTLRRCPLHPSLSLVVPLYNEEDNLQPLVESVFAVLAADLNFLELLLIDDGSSDRTAALGLRLANRESRIRLVSHDRNRGLGAAIRTGLQEAKGELILYTDGDLPFDFKLIPQLLTLATPDNVVVGWRTNRGEGLHRLLLSKGYNLLCHYLLGLHLRDVNFACKIIPRRALSRMQLNSEGSFIDAELLLECRRQGLAITEFPLTYYPRIRGQSTLSRPKVIVGILAEMIGYLFRPTHMSYSKLQEPARPRRQRYGAAAVGFALTSLLNLLLHPISRLSLLAIFLAVVVWITRYSGEGAGLVTIGLAALFRAYFLWLGPLTEYFRSQRRPPIKNVYCSPTLIQHDHCFSEVSQVRAMQKS